MPSSEPELAIAVDIGGTFTDISLVDHATGKTWRAKTPSLPSDPSEAFLTGIRLALADAGATGGGADAGAARHDDRHQHDPGGQGRARRPGHHPRLPARAWRSAGRTFRARPTSTPGSSRSGRCQRRASSRSTSASSPAAAIGRPLDEASVRAAADSAAPHGGATPSPCACCTPSPTRRTSNASPRSCATCLPGVAVTISTDVLPEVREYRALADRRLQCGRHAWRHRAMSGGWSGGCRTSRPQRRCC